MSELISESIRSSYFTGLIAGFGLGVLVSMVVYCIFDTIKEKK